MTKKILILSSTFPRWSNDHVASFVYDLAREQAKKMPVVVLAPYSKGSKLYEEKSGMKIYRFKYWFERKYNLTDGGILPNLRRNPFYFLQIPPFVLSEIFSAIKIVRKEKIDLIHAQWIIPQGFTAMIIKKLFKVNYIVTSLGGDMFPLQTKNKPVLWLYKMIIINSSFMTAVNKSFIPQLDKLNNKKSYYIPNGVDITRFKKIPGNKRKKNILFVGRLVEKKGLIYLIEALTSLDRTLYLKLLVVGDGPLRKILQEKVNELGLNKKISFLGSIPYDRLIKLYDDSVLIVVPSVTTKIGDIEGFPTVYLDAMASGCPIITSKIDGIETIIKNNENGVVVKQKDPKALANAISNLINDDTLRGSIAQKALKDVRENYSWKTVGNQYSKLIAKL